MLDIMELDHRHIWHPCSQMKDYELFKPLHVIKASGCEIELSNGKKVIDAISSWWCKSLGHNHPRLKKAMLQQLERFEHVILANTTNETIVQLSKKLAKLIPSLDKVFYASDGSSAVEIAMKMSLHSRSIQGECKRDLFFSLENAYHGETIGTLSVSDVGIYRDPYQSVLIKSEFIRGIPYVSGMEDPLWNDCRFAWEKIENFLNPFRDRITAILVEPIVQGAAGMKIVSQDFLRRLRQFTKEFNIHLIADEIMTGIGRTGKMLASHHANIEPDFICLAKGLTSGWLPLSVVLTKHSIYDLFYDDYETGKSFLHSHTHSGNALAACVALEVLNIFSEEKICEKANVLGEKMRSAMKDTADQTKKLKNVRGIGAIVAADLICAPNRRMGFEVYQRATQLGALLRPIGNVIYWLPPLTMDMDTLEKLKDMTEQAIFETFR